MKVVLKGQKNFCEFLFPTGPRIGERCKNPPLIGHKLCRIHVSPEIKEKLKEKAGIPTKEDLTRAAWKAYRRWEKGEIDAEALRSHKIMLELLLKAIEEDEERKGLEKTPEQKDIFDKLGLKK